MHAQEADHHAAGDEWGRYGRHALVPSGSEEIERDLCTLNLVSGCDLERTKHIRRLHTCRSPCHSALLLCFQMVRVQVQGAVGEGGEGRLVYQLLRMYRDVCELAAWRRL